MSPRKPRARRAPYVPPVPFARMRQMIAATGVHATAGQPIASEMAMEVHQALVKLQDAMLAAQAAARHKPRARRDDLARAHIALALILTGRLALGGKITKFEAVRAAFQCPDWNLDNAVRNFDNLRQPLAQAYPPVDLDPKLLIAAYQRVMEYRARHDSRTDRRRFVLALICGTLAMPLVANAQTAKTVRRIGWLSPATPPPRVEREEQVAPLREFGWSEGQNLLIERRYASSKYDLLQPMAEELVRLKVELIVAEGTSATLAAKNATTVIPIVMRSSGDPVRSGLVASLARPGGNVRGYSIVGPEIDTKGIALLRELLPGLQRVGVLMNPTSSYYRDERKDIKQACRSIGIEPIFIEVTAKSELETAVAEAARLHAQALIVQSDRPVIDSHLQVMDAALKHALPTEAQGKEFLEAGALISFDYSLAELRRRGAAFIDKILRGANPADLPIEQPTQFELGLNLKTAKALGITVPQSMLVRANAKIQ